MTAPVLRRDLGTLFSVTLANAIASLGYSNSADKLTIDNTSNLALLADFELQFSWGTGLAPVAGAVQLIAVDYGVLGAVSTPSAPSASLLGRVEGTFSPQYASGNAVIAAVLTLNSVSVKRKTDYYLYNNATGQSIPIGAVLKAQCWSPGT